MNLHKTNFEFGKKTYIMGILNVTPDSFFDGGEHSSPEAALYHAQKLLKEGADIIDLGGESTRPGFAAVAEEDELSRVVPVLELLVKNINAPISIDTQKPAVAYAAARIGASMINDISGTDFLTAEAVRDTGLPVCIAHNRKEPYSDFISDFFEDFEKILQTAKKLGIPREKIILDPGLGFAKTCEQNFIVLKNLDKLKKRFGLPLLVGASNKSFIGQALGDVPLQKRGIGNHAVHCAAILYGADILRVHDVKSTKELCLVADKIKRTQIF